MLFNSLEFALFFPFVVSIYFLLTQKLRVPWLLVASCAFYMAFIPGYILILFVTILIDFVAGIRIERAKGKCRKAWLIGSIVSTCLVLFVFKYYNFFVGGFISGAQLLGWALPDARWDIILPVGLSFHTFQSLSYVVEVYRGRQKAEYNLVTYSTFVMFFPQLVAGPIERPQNLLHQFCEVHRFDYSRVTSGLKRMAWGFFKKLVVADRLALYVNDVFGAPASHNGLQLTIGTIFFAYQIYCDFSGYSDIALGSARVLGFNLMENFDSPYHSKSVSEFWRRWHISLSTWFKDYVYVPMGGSRVSKGRWVINVFATFGVSGLWHGANWTYLFWGLLNGLYLVVGQFTSKIRGRFFGLLGIQDQSTLRKASMLTTTFVLTCGAWIVFRAESLSDAGYIFTHLFQNWDLGAVKTQNFQLKHFPVAIGAILILESVEMMRCRFQLGSRISNFPGSLRWTVYLGFFFVVVLFGVYRSSEFIYFQF